MIPAPYTIREIDRADGLAAPMMQWLDAACFPGRASAWPGGADSMWWLVLDAHGEPAAYCALARHSAGGRTGYLSRAGVLPEHRGHGLQAAMIRVREDRARRIGFNALVTNVNPENVASANNLIDAGFRLYRPGVLWDGEGRLYLRKVID